MGTELKTDRVWLHRGDAFKWLRRLKTESVDCVVTDYPYESLEKHRSKGTTTRLKNSKASSNKWFGTVPNDMAGELLFQCFRVLKRDRHAYFCCDDETSDVLKIRAFEEAKQKCAEAGIKGKLTYWKRLVWDKMAMGMGYHYRARYEFILFFEKGKRKLNNLGVPDVLSYKRIRSKDAYPTEKPVELLQVLIENSCKPGELVIDPFMGSASTGEAALLAEFRDDPIHGCFFWGNDISPDSIDFAVKRLEPYTRVAEYS